MKPDPKLITINTSQALVEQFIAEVILAPRLSALEWSKITKQSPGLKIGYPAQHIASLLTGVEGRRTAARGDDLADGSEVKGCNRVDQLDTCKKCGEKVLRSEKACWSCGATEIARKDDSKWLFTLKSQEELDLYLKKIPRVLMILLDYPAFEMGDFETLSIKAFEIWPSASDNFCTLLDDYYNKIYLEHIKKNPNKTPAPKNFWPYSFQFYMCKPVKIFECTIEDVNEAPKISTQLFVPPQADRSTLTPEGMPIELLTNDEIEALIESAGEELNQKHGAAFVDWAKMPEKQRYAKVGRSVLDGSVKILDSSFVEHLTLRDTSKATPHAVGYQRR